MNTELQALIDNKTWELTELPTNKKPIGCKWVYKVKLKADGTVERCKARLVAKGFKQEYGIDYQEVFSPLANLVIVRLLIVVATASSWPLHLLDINNAFLYVFLHDDIYMKAHQGLTGVKANQVC